MELSLRYLIPMLIYVLSLGIIADIFQFRKWEAMQGIVRAWAILHIFVLIILNETVWMNFAYILLFLYLLSGIKNILALGKLVLKKEPYPPELAGNHLILSFYMTALLSFVVIGDAIFRVSLDGGFFVLSLLLLLAAGGMLVYGIMLKLIAIIKIDARQSIVYLILLPVLIMCDGFLSLDLLDKLPLITK